eukprot:gene848-143_t
MLEILKAYGIPEKIVRAIGIMYSSTEAKVRSTDGDTDFFEISVGVLQGDTLVPFLFIIALDYAMRIATRGFEHLGFTIQKRRSARHPATTITDADFADDIALLSDCKEKATILLHRVEEAAKKIGLHINVSKTEYISIKEHGQILSSSGDPISKSEDFQYLGSWIMTTKRDIEVKIAEAWAAHNKLRTIWNSDMSRRYKINFFRATVESILLYGVESWTLTKALENRLNGTYNPNFSVPR